MFLWLELIARFRRNSQDVILFYVYWNEEKSVRIAWVCTGHHFSVFVQKQDVYGGIIKVYLRARKVRNSSSSWNSSRNKISQQRALNNFYLSGISTKPVNAEFNPPWETTLAAISARNNNPTFPKLPIFFCNFFWGYLEFLWSRSPPNQIKLELNLCVKNSNRLSSDGTRGWVSRRSWESR